jgi:hypothetical protein
MHTNAAASNPDPQLDTNAINARPAAAMHWPMQVVAMLATNAKVRVFEVSQRRHTAGISIGREQE